MEKFKQFVKDHETQIIVGTGFVVSVVVARAYCIRQRNHFINIANEGLADMFYEKQGNFTVKDGYDVPQWVKV